MTGVPLPRLLGYRGPEVSCADVGDGRGEPVVVVIVVAVVFSSQGELEGGRNWLWCKIEISDLSLTGTAGQNTNSIVYAGRRKHYPWIHSYPLCPM